MGILRFSGRSQGNLLASPGQMVVRVEFTAFPAQITVYLDGPVQLDLMGQISTFPKGVFRGALARHFWRLSDARPAE